MNIYENQANEFLAKTNTTIKVEYLKFDYHFKGDKDKRDIYSVTIQRGSRSFSFNFGQSVFCSGEYIGHKIYCTNMLGRYLFTKKEYKKIPWSNECKSTIIPNINYKIPSNYDILVCLTRCDVGTLEDFCNCFGYDVDSISASKIYKSVLNEYQNVCMIWNESEIELLQEIQ